MIYRFVEWLNRDTTGKFENNLLAIVIRSTSIISIVYYFYMMFVFLINKQYVIAVYDILGIGLLLYSIVLTYKGKTTYSFWVYSASLLLLAIFNAIYAGWEIGYQYSIFLLVVVAFFSTYLSGYVKIGLISFYAIVFLAEYLYCRCNKAQVLIYNGTDAALSIITIIYIFGGLAIAGYYYSAKSTEIDKQLVSYSKTLEKLAFFDPLTGLFNRRQTTVFLEKRISEAKQNDDKPLSVVIGDIDYFKKVNDTYGHEMGDEVLKEVSKRIKAGAANKALVSRWGGEEFLMIFPSSDKKTALHYAEEILDIVRQSPVIHGGIEVTVTMSFGVCQYEKGMTADEMVSKADMCLYQAKESGRNRVIV